MVEIKIVLSDNGEVSVHGPLENKLLCLGLIEAAKPAIMAYKASAVIPAPAGALHALPKANG